MGAMLFRWRRAIQRSGRGERRPEFPAVARSPVGGRDNGAKRAGRASSSKPGASLVSRWIRPANSLPNLYIGQRPEAAYDKGPMGVWPGSALNETSFRYHL